MVRLFGLAALILLAPPAAADYEQELHYVGMACAKAQRDTLASPANEIFINTVVYDPRTGRRFAAKHPHNAKVYADVRDGFVARGPQKLLWRGRARELSLLVAMWEHDDGGRTVNEFTYAFAQIATAYLAKRVTAGLPPTPPGQISDIGPGDLHRQLASYARGLFGANNDPLGHHLYRLSGGNWSELSPKSAHGIRYHIATRHRRGADCSAYFRFERGRYYKPAQEPARASPPPVEHVAAPGPGLECRAAYDDCAGRVERCRADYAHAERRAQHCESSMSEQYQQCVSFYLDRKRRPHEAIAVCKEKHSSALARCPRPRRDTCPDYAPCQADYRACEQSAQAREAGAAGERLPAPPPAPPIRQRPPEEPGYLVFIKNACDRDTSVAYHYLDFDGTWITGGWQNLEPGETVLPHIYTDHEEVYIHATVGELSQRGRNDAGVVLPVINPPFKHVKGTSLAGSGRREVRFHKFAFAGAGKKVTASIAGCERPPPKRRVEYHRSVDDAEIFQAAVNYDWDRVKELLAAGVPVDAKNKQGQTVMMIAALTNRRDVLRWLRDEKKAKQNFTVPDYPGGLYEDIRADPAVVWKYLVREGAGEFATAVWMGNTKMVDEMIAAGASAKDLSAGERRVLVMGTAYQAQLALLERMAADGVDLKVADDMGRTAFHWAVLSPSIRYRQLPALLGLLEHAGADPAAIDRTGRSAADYAKARRYAETLEWLVARGAPLRD